MAMVTDDGREWLTRTDDVVESLAGAHKADHVRLLALDLAHAGEVIASLRADVDHWRTLAQQARK